MGRQERPLRVDGYGPSANQRGQSRSWHSGVVQKSEGFRWVGRLGRNYADVTEVIRQFMARGVIIRTVINGLTCDGATKDPMQKAVRDALIAFMAATAEAQAEATREAQRAGIHRRHSTHRAFGYSIDDKLTVPVAEVEQRLEFGRRQRLRHVLVGLEQRQEIALAPPDRHGVALDERPPPRVIVLRCGKSPRTRRRGGDGAARDELAL